MNPLPWLLQVDWPLPVTLGWFLAMGLLIPGFTLSWTMAKEANPPAFAGIATSVVNVGIFLGAGLLQPLVGWVLDRGAAAGGSHAWSDAMAVMAGAAALGAVSTWFTRGDAAGPARSAPPGGAQDRRA